MFVCFHLDHGRPLLFLCSSEHKDHSEKKHRDKEKLKHGDGSSEKHRDKHKEKRREEKVCAGVAALCFMKAGGLWHMNTLKGHLFWCALVRTWLDSPLPSELP